MHLTHLLKVITTWISVVYIICYAGVALFPQSRDMFMEYALHTEVSAVSVLNVTNFFTGLIIWNIVAVLAVVLFSYLYNVIKK